MIFDLKEDGTGSCTMGGIGVDLTYTFDGSALTYTITGADGTEQTASFQYDADKDVLFYTCLLYTSPHQSPAPAILPPRKAL